MKIIRFHAVYGDHYKQVQLSAPTGGGGNAWQVMIDRYYQGMLTKRNNRWEGHFNARSEIEAADVAILGEIIDREGY